MVILFHANAIFIMMHFEFQLKLCKGISYAAVAAHADKSGRRKLAAMLVEHEPRSSKQVCFLHLFLIVQSFCLCYLTYSISLLPFQETKVPVQSCCGKNYSCLYFIWGLSFQVPLLLSIGEEDVALTKATESGDTDLVYLVIFHIWQKVLLPCIQTSP